MTLATRTVEKYAVSHSLMQVRRGMQTLVDNLLDEEKTMESYKISGRDAQELQVLLDRLEEIDGPINWRHD